MRHYLVGYRSKKCWKKHCSLEYVSPIVFSQLRTWDPWGSRLVLLRHPPGSLTLNVQELNKYLFFFSENIYCFQASSQCLSKHDSLSWGFCKLFSAKQLRECQNNFYTMINLKLREQKLIRECKSKKEENGKIFSRNKIIFYEENQQLQFFFNEEPLHWWKGYELIQFFGGVRWIYNQYFLEL